MAKKPHKPKRDLMQEFLDFHLFGKGKDTGVDAHMWYRGDILYYDPKGNVFAVSNKEGAPRTMFKPDDGMAYWEKQKDREARSQSARSNRKSRSADDQAD